MAETYFIRPVGMDGPVKIGCSNMPRERLVEIMRWSPFPLEIVATIEGPRALELRFHAKFRHLHTHKEWFRPDPEITATIVAVQAGTFDVTSLPPGEFVTRATAKKAA